MLHVEDALAMLHRRRGEERDELRMLVEEIGMLLQEGDHFAFAGLALARSDFGGLRAGRRSLEFIAWPVQ